MFCMKAIKFTVVGLEDDVVGLGEAHDEDEVDDKESEKVFGDHPVDHDHKGANDLNCPGMILYIGEIHLVNKYAFVSDKTIKCT